MPLPNHKIQLQQHVHLTMPLDIYKNQRQQIVYLIMPLHNLKNIEGKSYHAPL